MLAEGASMRSSSRIARVSMNTVAQVLEKALVACPRHHDQHVRGLDLESIQCDEIWSFVYGKARNFPLSRPPSTAGDIWTWTAIDRETKLIVAYHVGSRGTRDANAFMRDLERRLDTTTQITTDRHRPYEEAIEQAFGPAVHYAQIGKKAKIEGEQTEKEDGSENRVIMGNPLESAITTSHVERCNLTIRQHNARYSRKVLSFSKRVHRHLASTALFVTYYNFCRVHSTIKTTPAIAAGLDSIVRQREWLADLLREMDPKPGRRGPYRKSAKTLVTPAGETRGRRRALRSDIQCPYCRSNWLPKRGRTAAGQAYECRECGYRFTIPMVLENNPA